jgi:hypothetical protein
VHVGGRIAGGILCAVGTCFHGVLAAVCSSHRSRYSSPVHFGLESDCDHMGVDSCGVFVRGVLRHHLRGIVDAGFCS